MYFPEIAVTLQTTSAGLLPAWELLSLQAISTVFQIEIVHAGGLALTAYQAVSWVGRVLLTVLDNLCSVWCCALQGRKRFGAPLGGRTRRAPALPHGPEKRSRHKGGKGKPGKGKAKKGRSKGQSARKEEKDRPAGEPDQQLVAKAKKRPNKSQRRGRRSNKALLKRAEQGFEKDSEELVRRTAAAKPKPTRRHRLRITPRVEQFKEQWASLSFRERVAAQRELRESGLLPPGSVGEHILKPFQDPCSTCDERQKAQKPHVLQAEPLYKEDDADDEEEEPEELRGQLQQSAELTQALQAQLGDPAAFNDWIFILRSYLSAMDQRYQALLQRAEISATGLWNRTLDATEKGLCTQLYFLLVMLCRDRALDKLHNAGASGRPRGLEALRQLYMEYNPKLSSRYVGLLLEILRYRFEGDLVSCVEAFESKVREYEKQSGKEVEDDTIIGIVILGMADAAVKEHLVRHASRLDTWGKMLWRDPGDSQDTAGRLEGNVPKAKGVCITAERLIKYGRTKGCDAPRQWERTFSSQRPPKKDHGPGWQPAARMEASEVPPSSPRSPSRKREADGSHRKEMTIAGLPILHEWRVEPDLLTTVLAATYDERTGELLDEEDDISYQEARSKGLRLVKSRWVDTAKEINGKPGEVNTYKREDVSMGTPPLRVHRAVMSHAATAKPGQKVSKKLVARYDVSVAFFHAENSERIGVIPPTSEGTPDIMWELRKAMNGTREASRQWGEKIRKVKKSNGYDELLLCPNTYYFGAGDVALSCHGDDFLASGEATELDRLDEIIMKNYEVKVLPRIGDPNHGGTGRHLGRVITWTGSGFTWEADPKYLNRLWRS
ncbi:unnamed protein product [Symbiodinium sp. CCMP2592]|nr:unnamed protein product [Symbiodinium sp. CCMP2592]